ncbi:TPA: molecular chaperone [Pseudomonas aeruginosa]|uniref:fimbrial biogenesis chaperone n=1 Tax=Pseudomonas aeruginosa TaxID=287 RepID=UPI000F827596|nr:molecular chaperone [Pseudomonas aeruginosa]MDV6567723.1 molecular chaperone [Pseudomonas aeruginosa]MDX4009737.1 molecular chaperone [Pseudomonas aeruginosa]MEB5088699.1 molecular chaperone [Pseudomonas aeruginosa]MEB5094745.1 molecular chaperone [Pseudomonas aeruginosa]MEB5106874.1 molecular chaperone [Pseudomonas aeruginosa]
MTGVGLGRCGTAWVLLVALVADASASLSVIGTRFIYPAGVSALTIRVGNVGTRPALVQAWLDRGDETADPSAVTVPFILSPPLLRMDPQETQALQLRHTGEPLPDDRESLFWVNLLEVPGREDGSGNLLLVSYRLRMKLLFRPQGLAGDPRSAARQVVWRLRPAVRPGQRALLEADNRSPYHVSLVRLELGEGDLAMSLGSVTLPPFALTPLSLPAVPGEAAQVHFDAVGDDGQIERGDAPAERYP